LLAAVAVLALLVGACSSSSSNNDAQEVNQGAPADEGPPQDGGTLRVAVGAEIDGLYPIQARWSLEGNLIGSSLYDTLMTFDEDRNLVPRLAESMTPNADGTVWTIELRPNVNFHDGTPFDGEAVKANIEARKAQAVTGEALAPIEQVVVVDPLTVEVHMSRPWFGYDYTVAAQGGYMVAPSLIGQPDAMQRAIGTGPFKLEGATWSPGTPVNVVRNEDYWGDTAHLDGIEFEALLDQSSRTAALEAGDVDLIFTQDPASVSAFRSKSGFVQVEDFAAEETFVMLNVADPPLNNINARQALAYATNREAINAAVGGGIQEDADQPYTKDERYYVADSGYPTYDPAAAEQALQRYKDETGESELSFTLGTPSSNQQKSEAQLLQAQWSEVGIKVDINEAEQATFLTDTFAGNFQAAMFRNFAYVNPDSNYIFWHSSYAKEPGELGGINFGQIRSDAIDSALDTARNTPDPDQRIEQHKNVVRAINEEVPYIWLYHGVWGLAGSEAVGGLTAPQRLGFARQDAKPWWPQIWLKQ
jgi:peptide/nickel transport system substrate-binding protein